MNTRDSYLPTSAQVDGAAQEGPALWLLSDDLRFGGRFRCLSDGQRGQRRYTNDFGEPPRLPTQFDMDTRMDTPHDPSRTHKQVIILRNDLNMRKGKMIAQGAHASMKAVLDAGAVQEIDGRRCLVIPLDDERLGPWLEGKFAKIAVRAESEAELLELHAQAQAAGVISSLIQDAGLTEFGGVPTYTALAIGPDVKEDLDPLTGHLKLL